MDARGPLRSNATCLSVLKSNEGDGHPQAKWKSSNPSTAASNCDKDSGAEQCESHFNLMAGLPVSVKTKMCTGVGPDVLAG
jgi:hypothetical protein